MSDLLTQLGLTSARQSWVGEGATPMRLARHTITIWSAPPTHEKQEKGVIWSDLEGVCQDERMRGYPYLLQEGRSKGRRGVRSKREERGEE